MCKVGFEMSTRDKTSDTVRLTDLECPQTHAHTHTRTHSAVVLRIFAQLFSSLCLESSRCLKKKWSHNLERKICTCIRRLTTCRLRQFSWSGSVNQAECCAVFAVFFCSCLIPFRAIPFRFPFLRPSNKNTTDVCVFVCITEDKTFYYYDWA